MQLINQLSMVNCPLGLITTRGWFHHYHCLCQSPMCIKLLVKSFTKSTVRLRWSTDCEGQSHRETQIRADQQIDPDIAISSIYKLSPKVIPYKILEAISISWIGKLLRRSQDYVLPGALVCHISLVWKRIIQWHVHEQTSGDLLDMTIIVWQCLFHCHY